MPGTRVITGNNIPQLHMEVGLVVIKCKTRTSRDCYTFVWICIHADNRTR